MERLAGDLVELLMLRSVVGPHRRLWTTAYALLALPPSLRGRPRRYVATVDGAEVSIVCVGRPERFERVLPRLFPDMRMLAVGRLRWLWAPRGMRSIDADVVAVEIHPWLPARFRRAGWAVVSQNLRWCAALDELPPKRPSKSLRTNLKRVRALSHRVELVERPTPSDLQEFRAEMAAPLARKRFGALTWEPSELLFRSLAKRCALLFIRMDGRRVAGEMVVAAGDRAYTPLLGIRHGDTELLKAGVQSALYAAFFDYARRSGARSVDSGLTTSFVNDGVAYYKRQWGLAPCRADVSPLLAFKVDLNHPAVAAAFDREPLVTLTNGGFGRLPD